MVALTEGLQRFVAVVDDEAALREATESLLRSAGYAARGFSSAEEFLQSRYRDDAGCVVLDIGLPGISGIELQKRLSGSVHIVFVSGADDGDGRMQAQALRSGAIAFLRKPFSDCDLLRAIDASLGRRISPSPTTLRIDDSLRQGHRKKQKDPR
jgi:FixJ family two-component response regulator